MYIFLVCAFCWERLIGSYQIFGASIPKQVKKHWIQESFFSYLAFRCSECQESLTNWYYEKDGKLYCHKDYWRKFGEFCHGCSLLMTGPVMVSESLHLCPSWSSESTDSVSSSHGCSSSGLSISHGLSLIQSFNRGLLSTY